MKKVALVILAVLGLMAGTAYAFGGWNGHLGWHNHGSTSDFNLFDDTHGKHGENCLSCSHH
ncbi:hypothetical protein J4N42_06440 [Vibrio sp. SCSIO 43135]|uniref:hypothetical protein n=1 Tax=Vibrio sp. SCSIO 43135 TaxID=2819096 RepID=UPI002075BC4D|nr:hypothetical protein [Vibrio sp. SCSIO 43135]USD42353.1 hypothetical protein J4N42_06440 [Vibrio sp. SCSIO 43135]